MSSGWNWDWDWIGLVSISSFFSSWINKQQGTSTAYTTTTTVGTDEFHYAQVTITAGASKLTGTSTSKGAAPRITGVVGAVVAAGLGGVLAVL